MGNAGESRNNCEHSYQQFLLTCVDRYATKQGFRRGAKLTSVFAKVFHKISGCCKSEKIVLRIVTSSSDNISRHLGIGTTSRRLFLNLKDTVRIFLFDLTGNIIEGYHLLQLVWNNNSTPYLLSGNRKY